MRPIVTDRVAWSVGQTVTLVIPAKTAEPIKMPCGLRTSVGPENHALDGMPFGLWARMGPRNHVLDGVQIPMGRAILGETGANCKV